MTINSFVLILTKMSKRVRRTSSTKSGQKRAKTDTNDRSSKIYKACKNSIVTLKLLSSSVTNENRRHVVNPDFAKFRTDKARVISIVNPETEEKLAEDSSMYRDDFVYKVGKIVKSHFNPDINRVCGGGIHYFKTKETALSWFYQQTHNKYSDGKSAGWHENGQKRYEGSYKDGKMDGKWTNWYDNGQKKNEGSHKDGYSNGKWTGWYSNGQKAYEQSYKDGKRDGKRTEWALKTYKDLNL